MKRTHVGIRLTALTLVVTGLLALCLIPLFHYLSFLHAEDVTPDPAFFAANPRLLLTLTLWLMGIAMLPVALAAWLLRTMFTRRARAYRRRRRALSCGGSELWRKVNQAKPAFATTQALRWMADVAPLVEEVAGCPFRLVPLLKLADWREVGKVLAHDMLLPREGKALARLKDNGLADWLMELTAMQSTLAVAPYVIGKYGVSNKTLYLLPRNTSAVLELAGLETAAVEPMVKLTLVHELVHALQDEHAALGDRLARQRRHNSPAAQAFNVVIEGQAMVIQELVAQRLGYDAAQAALNRLLLGAKPQPPMPGGGAGRPRMSAIYQLGRDYMWRRYEVDGALGLWAAVDEPPDSVAALRRSLAPAPADAVGEAAPA